MAIHGGRYLGYMFVIHLSSISLLQFSFTVSSRQPRVGLELHMSSVLYWLHLANRHTHTKRTPFFSPSNIKIRLAHVAQSLPTSTNASVSPSSRLPDVACSHRFVLRRNTDSGDWLLATKLQLKGSASSLFPSSVFPPLLLWHVPVVTVVRLLHNRWREDPMPCLLVLRPFLLLGATVPCWPFCFFFFFSLRLYALEVCLHTCIERMNYYYSTNV